jgi:transposase
MKLHLAVDAHGLPVRVVITQDGTADCTQAIELMAGIRAKHLLADRGYDNDALIKQAKAQSIKVVIPPRKNRKRQRTYNSALYRWRHLLKTPSYTSSDGAASPHAMPKIPLYFSPPLNPLHRHLGQYLMTAVLNN